MNAVVLYKSKSGYAKKYAEWISKELSADLFDASTANADMLSHYDTIVFGGSLYASGINGIKLIKDNLHKLTDKTIAIYATGVAPLRKDAIEEVKDRNFSKADQSKLGFFYMRGGFDYNKLTPVDKVLMKLLYGKIKLKVLLKKELIDDEKGMLTVYKRPADFTRKENIEPLISYVKSKAYSNK